VRLERSAYSTGGARFSGHRTGGRIDRHTGTDKGTDRHGTGRTETDSVKSTDTSVLLTKATTESKSSSSQMPPIHNGSGGSRYVRGPVSNRAAAMARAIAQRATQTGQAWFGIDSIKSYGSHSLRWTGAALRPVVGDEREATTIRTSKAT